MIIILLQKNKLIIKKTKSRYQPNSNNVAVLRRRRIALAKKKADFYLKFSINDKALELDNQQQLLIDQAHKLHDKIYFLQFLLLSHLVNYLEFYMSLSHRPINFVNLILYLKQIYNIKLKDYISKEHPSLEDKFYKQLDSLELASRSLTSPFKDEPLLFEIHNLSFNNISFYNFSYKVSKFDKDRLKQRITK